MSTYLRKYHYEFEWKHGSTASIITGMRTLTPRSKEFVSMLSGPSVMVFGITSDEPYVRLGNFPLQQLGAVVEEIERERKRIIKEDVCLTE